MQRLEPGYTGWLNLTAANLSAGCPAPLQGKGLAEDMDVTKEKAPSPRCTHTVCTRGHLGKTLKSG